MNRRTILFGLAGGGLAVGGYAIWRLEQAHPDRVHVVGDVFTDGRHGGNLDWKEQYHTIIENEATAETVLTDTVSSFVAATDFTDSSLLVIQTGVQSSAVLKLETIEWIDGSLHVDVAVTYPGGGSGDDLITHSLLIRITDKATPEDVNITITGYV